MTAREQHDYQSVMLMKRPLISKDETDVRSDLKETSDLPLVSVIVVAYRDLSEVQSLVENISPFRSGDVELIIIDGGSDDGTLEFLRSNSHRIDYWISEQDRGIYDAMNKGIKAARGSYVLHLNAGDRLRQIPMELLRQCIEDNIDVVSCGVLMDGKDVFVPKIGFKMRIDNYWHHQGTFYRRSKHLGYNAAYRICGDFEHNQRLIRAGCSVRLLPQVVSEHRNDGISMHKSSKTERLKSVRAHFGVIYLLIAVMRLEFMKLRRAVKEILP